MDGKKIAEYLGLRNAEGSPRTKGERVYTVVMIAVVAMTLFLTRGLEGWRQLGVLGVTMVITGLLGGVVLVTLAKRRPVNA